MNPFLLLIHFKVSKMETDPSIMNYPSSELIQQEDDNQNFSFFKNNINSFNNQVQLIILNNFAFIYIKYTMMVFLFFTES